MDLKERLRADLNAARRSRARLQTELLTMTLSEVRNREIELGRAIRVVGPGAGPWPQRRLERAARP